MPRTSEGLTAHQRGEYELAVARVLTGGRAPQERSRPSIAKRDQASDIIDELEAMGAFTIPTIEITCL